MSKGVNGVPDDTAASVASVADSKSREDRRISAPGVVPVGVTTRMMVMTMMMMMAVTTINLLHEVQSVNVLVEKKVDLGEFDEVEDVVGSRVLKVASVCGGVVNG